MTFFNEKELLFLIFIFFGGYICWIYLYYATLLTYVVSDNNQRNYTENGYFFNENNTILKSYRSSSFQRISCDLPTGGLDPLKQENYCSFMTQKSTYLKPGSVCLMRSSQSRPTQQFVGLAIAHCMADSIALYDANTYESVVSSHPIPIILANVLFSENQKKTESFFILDHHHLVRAVFQSGIETLYSKNNTDELESFNHDKPIDYLYACIQDDRRNESESIFYDRMKREKLLYLYNENGDKINYTDLPIGVKYLRDNPFRTLSNFMLYSNGYLKCYSNIDNQICKNKTSYFFLENIWAEYFRSIYENLITDKRVPQLLNVEVNSIPYIQRCSLQNQISSFVNIYDDVLKTCLSKRSSFMPGYNNFQKKITPKRIKIDDHGCSNFFANN